MTKIKRHFRNLSIFRYFYFRAKSKLICVQFRNLIEHLTFRIKQNSNLSASTTPHPDYAKTDTANDILNYLHGNYHQKLISEPYVDLRICINT